MLLLMFIGGAAQSTAGGVKVNAFAAAVLSLFAVIRGKSRVEVFRRQLSVDSIRRSNATLVMYLMILFPEGARTACFAIGLGFRVYFGFEYRRVESRSDSGFRRSR